MNQFIYKIEDVRAMLSAMPSRREIIMRALFPPVAIALGGAALLLYVSALP